MELRGLSRHQRHGLDLLTCQGHKLSKLASFINHSVSGILLQKQKMNYDSNEFANSGKKIKYRKVENCCKEKNGNHL
jgi:hypothetical protein